MLSGSHPAPRPARALAHFIADLQLATGLLDTVEVREVGVDRGPWPTWLRLSVAALAVLVGWFALRLIRVRRRAWA
ncbi:hypothetical protein K1W54_31880 [Micromonospora sp. CPCC 205371]|nr:hypothetical protein [Micromonospora sp. CPCC 205371]